MWSARQKVRQETRNSQGEYSTYDAAPSEARLSFDEGGLSSDEDFQRLAEEHGVDVTGNDGSSVEVHGRAQDIRALAYEVEERHGAAPEVTVVASEDSDPAWSENLEDYTDSEEVTARVAPGDAANESEGEGEASDEVRYSFLADFEEAEEKFNTDFDGIPNRFFNADLRGKVLNNVREDDLDVLHEKVGEHERGVNRYFDDRGLAGRLCHSVSSPAENKMSDEQAEELLAELDGVTEVQRIDDPPLLGSLSRQATRGWLAKIETTNSLGDREERWLAVTDASHNKLNPYTLQRSRGDLRARQQFTQTDLRSLAGAKRIEERTGENLLEIKASSSATRGQLGVNRGDYPNKDQNLRTTWDHDEYKALAAETRRCEAASMQASVTALAAMEDAQLEGRNFLAQKKYVKEQNSTVASAFDDKKHPDKAHQQMMADTSLSSSNGGMFTKVEIDNDVDPQEYADFEAAVHEVESKMPPLPEGRRPDLRIRKLGKHRANGVFSPAHNTVAVDVRTSEAYVHEMGHYYDLVAKGNASLSEDFKDISRRGLLRVRLTS